MRISEEVKNELFEMSKKRQITASEFITELIIREYEEMKKIEGNEINKNRKK